MKDLVLIFTSIALAVAGQLLLKQGMIKIGYVDLALSNLLSFLRRAFFSPFVLVGLVVFGISFAMWLVILSRVELSKVYPMVAVGYVLTVLFSWIFFRETVSVMRILAVSLIVLGVMILSRS